jgi:hypothetical protein
MRRENSMLGPLGGDRLWSPKDLDKCKQAAQEVVNAQDKGADEGGIIYGYMYAMNNSNYGFKGEDLTFKTKDEITAFDANGQVKETYVVYKE